MGGWQSVLAVILSATLLFFGLDARADTSSPTTLKLLGRSSDDQLELELPEADRRWLDSKKTLVVGVAGPDYPPLEIAASGEDLEGITADYLGILESHLNVQIQIQQFPDQDSAIQSLHRGEIDLLSRATNSAGQLPGVMLSEPYLVNQPVVIGRQGNYPIGESFLSGKRIAAVERYFSDAEFTSSYPHSELVRFDSLRHALEAVSFGRVDAFMGDAISAQYLISQEYRLNLKMLNFAKFNGGGFSFALDTSNTRLLKILNETLDSIPAQTRQQIQRRWEARAPYSIASQQLALSPGEQRWLERNPRPVLVVDQSLAPLTFFDSHGNFSGIAADLLDLVSTRTGLQFEVQAASSIPEMLQRVRQGQAYAVAALTPTPEREAFLDFTRPYLSTSFAVVANKADKQITSLADLKHKRLAVPRGTALIPYIREHYPDIRMVEVENNADVLPLLSERKVDAAVHLMAAANFLISRYFKDLQIVGTLDHGPGNFSFAVSHAEPELLSILNKALLAIPPEDLSSIVSRWSTAAESSDNVWVRYRSQFYNLFMGVLPLVALIIAWNWWLQIKVFQRRQSEKELNYRLEFKRALIDGIPLPVAVRDRNGRLLTCNHSYLDFTGLSPGRAHGSSLADISWLDSQQAQELQEEYRQVMESGQPQAFDRVIEIQGQTRQVYDWVTPYRGIQGEVVGVVCGWVDMTERERLHHQLQIAKEQAEEASRAKSTFLATMSHEIRTPLSAVIGMLELALANSACASCHDRGSIEVAYDSAKSLLLLIGDILDLAKIEAGRLSLAPEPAQLRDLVESVVRVFDGQARQKGLWLNLDMDVASDRHVLIDPLRFKQILLNLVSNAIKFTDKGGINIRVSAAPLADDHLALEVSVEDTGIGIAKHEQERLFEPFTQAQHSVGSSRGGTGLGLSICRKLADMMGGTIHLDSEPGVGTAACVRLTLQTLEPSAVSVEPAAKPVREANRSLQVLVVDDHPANRMLLAQQLMHLSHHVVTADDGAMALEHWSPGRFDVVITDCNMPVLNGYALASRIREIELEHDASPCVILGLTANAQHDEIARCREAGMDDCLFKPIGLETLRARLAQVPHTADGVDSSLKLLSLGFDLRIVEELNGHAPDLTRQFIEQLHACNQTDAQQLDTLLIAQDWSQLSDLAHRIKGASRLIRADTLRDCCADLERACKDGLNEGEVRKRAQQVREAMDALQGQLLAYLHSHPMIPTAIHP